MNLSKTPSASRTRNRRLGRRAVLATVAITLVAAGCGGSGNGTGSKSTSSSSASQNADALLGPKQPATGTPVKVGFIGDGQGPATDTTIQTTTARALTKYLNDRKGGLGGHPIDLIVCEAHNDPSQSADCATKMIQSNVAMVVLGPLANLDPAWKPLHDAKILTVVSAAAATGPLLDKDSTLLFVDPTASLATLPITVAKENQLNKVTVVSLDVPAATGYYKALGAKSFGDAGIKLSLVPVPPGQADLLPQMSKVASSGPTEVHILGDDKFAIAAVKGLYAAGFSGPISCIGCDGEAAAKALGKQLKGIYAPYENALDDPSAPDTPKEIAILNTYGPGDDASHHRDEGYIMDSMLPLNMMLANFKGAFNLPNLLQAIRAYPDTPLPSGEGMHFRCNGKASDISPSSCVKGVLVAQLGSDGKPVPPFKPAGAGPVPS